jgi:2-polyprenyl-3-methyl-5-hydroxy-6-metoxy-1,4-benzoquinol methylase
MQQRVDRKAARRSRVTGTDERTYPLGHSDHELKRLEQLGALFGDFTGDALRRGGLAPGMRVLDVGCGVGDVSMMAASLVGSSGAVLGVDRSARAIDIARLRAAAAGQDWVRFIASEVDGFGTDERFDAIIGRLILMYLPDPAATLRRLCGRLRPGGIVVFQEMAIPVARCVPEGPQFRGCMDWICRTFAQSGAELDMGSKLYATFLAAGLPAPRMVLAGRAEGGPESPAYDFIAATARSVLPAAERLGVTTAAEVGIDTMVERLRREAVESNACVMLPPLVGAWSQLPG